MVVSIPKISAEEIARITEQGPRREIAPFGRPIWKTLKRERGEERGGALFYDPLSAKGFFVVAVVVVDEITLWA